MGMAAARFLKVNAMNLQILPVRGATVQFFNFLIFYDYMKIWRDSFNLITWKIKMWKINN